MGAFTTVTVRNGAAVVISFDMNFVVDGEKTALARGNYPEGDSKTNQVPAEAQQIQIVVRYERFIDDWKTVYDKTFPDTSTWPGGSLTLVATGNDIGGVKVAQSS